MPDIKDFNPEGFSLNSSSAAPAPVEANGSAEPAFVAAPAPVVEAAPLELAPETAPLVAAPEPVLTTPLVEAAPLVTAPVTVAAPVAPEPVVLDPFIAQLQAVVAAGGDVKAYLSAQLVDFDAMADESLARQKLRREFPAATDAQLNTAFKRRYTTDADLYDDDEVTMGQMQLQADAASERTAGKTEQAKLALPAARPAVDYSAEEAAASAAWKVRTTPILAGLTQLGVDLGVPGVAPLAVAVANRSFDAQVLAPETIYARWQDAAGQPDTARMAQDLAYLDNRAAVHAAIFAAGQRAVTALASNATPTGGDPVAVLPAGSAKSEQEQLFDGLRAARAARGLI